MNILNFQNSNSTMLHIKCLFFKIKNKHLFFYICELKKSKLKKNSTATCWPVNVYLYFTSKGFSFFNCLKKSFIMKVDIILINRFQNSEHKISTLIKIINIGTLFLF